MDVLTYLAELGVPAKVLTIGISLFAISQIIGELIEAFGKSSPYLLKLRKYIKDKIKAKKDREDAFNKTLLEVKQELTDSIKQKNKVESLLTKIDNHYNEDNIAKRDAWMLKVNSDLKWAKDRAKIYDASVDELKDLAKVVKDQASALELNNKMTSEVYKQMTRTQILDFSHKLVNARKADKPVIFSREEFKKIRKSYDAYEVFLEQFGGTNGEVDDAMKVIRKAEAGELPNIEFLEDLRD